MSESVSPMSTARGFATPSVTQFSVFLDNRVGKLLDLVTALEGCPQGQLCALTVHEASDHAVVRIVTSAARETKEILRRKGVAYSETELLVVELCNGHTMATLCSTLLGAELNIHFAYAMMVRPNGTATIALSVDDITLAGQLLRRKDFRLLGEADLPQR